MGAPLIYLAGPMRSKDGTEHPWRDMVTSLFIHWDRCLRPDVTNHEHDRLDAASTVSADLDMVTRSAAVLAYLDRHDRIGTLVEVGVAIGQKKPVILVVEGALHNRAEKRVAIERKLHYESEPDYGWPWFAEAAVDQRFVVSGDFYKRASVWHLATAAALKGAAKGHSSPVGGIMSRRGVTPSSTRDR